MPWTLKDIVAVAGLAFLTAGCGSYERGPVIKEIPHGFSRFEILEIGGCQYVFNPAHSDALIHHGGCPSCRKALVDAIHLTPERPTP